jgi:hypothetical protein
MLTKSFAVILLFLALSPFTAPFQTDTIENHEIASIERLSAIRQHADLRTLTIPRLPEPDCVGTAPTPSEWTVLSWTVRAGTLASDNTHAATGDYFALATVLRV